VGAVAKALSNESWRSLGEGCVKQGKASGVTIDPRAGQGEQDQFGQLAIAGNELTEGYKILLVSAQTDANLLPAVEEAMKAGVPVINVNDAVIPGAKNYIGNVQKDNGVRATRWFVKNRPHGGAARFGHNHYIGYAGRSAGRWKGMNMTFDPRTVGPRIRMLLPELTASETRITEILLRSDAAVELPLKAVAREAETSEAMVVKTAKRLGFSGYKELRSALTAYKNQPHVDLHQEITPDDTAETIVQKVFRTSIQALEETLAILDMEAFSHAAKLLHGAHQRDFYGLGGSAQIARDVAHKFLRIGIRASMLDDTHMMAMSASLLRAGDVVVAFSHSGRTSGVLDSVQIARANRASIIAVTNYASSPLAEMSDVVLCATAQGSYLTSENAAARIAQLNIMDAIFIAVAQKGIQAAEASLVRTMAAVSAKRKA
jgi:DNA-binding MurR/RpiR family transcriptional regulator